MLRRKFYYCLYFLLFIIFIPEDCFSLSLPLEENNSLNSISPLNNFENRDYLTLQNETTIDEAHQDLNQLFESNIKYFLNFGIHPETGLPYDSVTIDTEGNLSRSNLTSITNIGLGLASFIAANKLGVSSKEETINKIENVLDTLDKMEVHEIKDGEFTGKKYFYNWYDLNTLKPVNNWVSSIDLAWLATGLIVTKEFLGNEYPVLSERVKDWINAMDFSIFYSEDEDLMSAGFYVEPEGIRRDFTYRFLNSETRMISYLAIGKGDLSEEDAREHWNALSRYRAIKEDCYGMDIVGSAGGSAFEFGMPQLFVDESGLNPDNFGLNFKKAMLVQMLQAIEKGYLIWGESPATSPDYGYQEYGCRAGVNPYPSQGVITPHASSLALEIMPKEVSANLKLISLIYPEALNKEQGFVDTIATEFDRPIFRYLALDQGMLALSLTNYLADNYIRELFMSSEIGQKVKPYIEDEKFFTKGQVTEELENLFQIANDYLKEKKWQQAYIILNYIRDVDKGKIYDDIDEFIKEAKETGISEYQRLVDYGLDLSNSDEFAILLEARDAIKKAIADAVYLDIDYKQAVNLLNKIRTKIDEISPLHPKLPGIVISDFNDLARPTQHMEVIGKWAFGGKGAETDISFIETDNPDYRVALKLDYLVPTDTATGIWMKLKDVDLSQYKYLVFDVKGEPKGYIKKFNIELKYQNSTWPFPSYTVEDVTTSWQRVYIPVNELSPQIPEEKLNEVNELTFVFEYASGTIYIDNLHFE